MMNVAQWIHVLSLALQLAGALVLLFGNLTKRDVAELVEKERPKVIAAKSKEEGEKKATEMLKGLWRSKYVGMYRNAAAFIYLAIGYLLSIWSVNDYKNKMYVVIWTMIVCAIFCVLSYVITEVLGSFFANRKAGEKLPDGTTFWITEEMSDDEKAEKEEAEKGIEEQGKKADSEKRDFERVTKIITSILSILATCYLIVNELYKFQYRVECETTYTIPRAFFKTDMKDKFISVAALVLLIALAVFPSFIRGIGKRYGNEREQRGEKICSIIMAVFLGCTYGLMNLLFMMNIPFVREIINEDSIARTLIFILVIVVGVASVCGITLTPEIMSLKNRTQRKVGFSICLVLFFVTIIGFVARMVSVFEISVKDKTDYEFVIGAEKDYVVLADVEEDVLVVEYGEENGKLTFYTGQYSFIKRNEYSYMYGNMKSSPYIIHASKPDSENVDEPEASE